MNIYIKSDERFGNHAQERDKQRAKYNMAFSSYIRKIWANENPKNLTIEELEQIHHVRFHSCMWDWDKHCLIPEVEEGTRRV